MSAKRLRGIHVVFDDQAEMLEFDYKSQQSAFWAKFSYSMKRWNYITRNGIRLQKPAERVRGKILLAMPENALNGYARGEGFPKPSGCQYNNSKV